MVLVLRGIARVKIFAYANQRVDDFAVRVLTPLVIRGDDRAVLCQVLPTVTSPTHSKAQACLQRGIFDH